MNEDKLVEKFTKGVTQAAVQIGAAVVFFVFFSAAAASDPFFRKNMGQRYFTWGRAVLGLAGWHAMSYLVAFQVLWRGGKVPMVAAIVGTIIWLAYLVLSITNMLAIRKRRKTGEVWHSRSRGESIFGSENAIRDLIIEIIVFVALCFVSGFFALFFGLSRLLGYVAEAAAQAALYNRYLDIQDAKIEAEFMETALREGFPPRDTGGVYKPLPRCFTGAHRANVARVVAAGQFASGTVNPAATASKPMPESRPSAIPTPTANPKTDTPSVASVAGSRRGIYLAVLIIVVVAMTSGGFYLYHSSQERRNQPAAASITAQPQANPIASTFDTPVVASAVLAPPAEPAPVKVDNSAAIAQAALEAQQRQEREKLIEQINGTLAAQLAALSNLANNCGTRLDNNNNRLAEVSLFYKGRLTEKNALLQAGLNQVVTNQEAILNFRQVSFEGMIAKPQSNPQLFKDEMDSLIPRMQELRSELIADIDRLETEISNAPL